MSDSLFKHSSIMFSSILIANIFAYLYHIFIARFLGPASYGELGSLLAIFMILAVPISTIQNVISKFVAKFNRNHEENRIGSLILGSFKKLLIYGIFTFILL